MGNKTMLPGGFSCGWELELCLVATMQEGYKRWGNHVAAYFPVILIFKFELLLNMCLKIVRFKSLKQNKVTTIQLSCKN